MTVPKPLEIQTLIPEIFQEVQKGSQLFRKNCVALRKVHVASSEKGLEKNFIKVLILTLNHIFPIKRKEITVDRVVRFIGSYLKYSAEKDKTENIVSGEAEEGVALTLTNRLAEKLVTFYFQGLESSDKMTRTRVCQILAQSILYLGPIDADLYDSLREGFSQRLLDKEPSIRILAVQALAPLQGDDTPTENDEVVETLLISLQQDPSADVRRAILRNIVQNQRTIPAILKRCRDLDPGIRRDIYSKNMVEYKGFLEMTIEQRETLLKCGLSDREPEVKKACLNLLADNWFPQVDSNLLELLEKLDVMKNDVAEMTLKSYFEVNPEAWRNFSFPDNYLENLGIEGAFLARVVISFVHEKQELEKLDEILPTPFKMAELLVSYCNSATNCDDDSYRADLDFILVQLLEITALLDFGNEAGRRKIFSTLKKLIVQIDNNDEQIQAIVKVVKSLSSDEPDFTRSVFEFQTELFEDANCDLKEISIKEIESEMENESEPSDEHRNFLNAAYKCLMIYKHLLRLCVMTFEKNSTLSGILNDLIYPAAKSNIAALEEAGSECLGLCCMIYKDLAVGNINHFIHIYKEEDNEGRSVSLKIILDLCAIYGNLPAFQTPKIHDFFKLSLKESDPKSLATAALGIAKLFLSGHLRDPLILERMIQLYFVPMTQNNSELRQCLHYFLEVYSHFSPDNQDVMAKAFTPSLWRLFSVYKKFNNSQMVTPTQIIQQLADWTNPAKTEQNQLSSDIHGSIAIELLRESFNSDRLEYRKYLLQGITKLAIDTISSIPKLFAIKLLIETYREKREFPDSASKLALTKFEASILKRINKFETDLKTADAESQEGSTDALINKSLEDQVKTDAVYKEVEIWIALLEEENNGQSRSRKGSGKLISKPRKSKRDRGSDDSADESYHP